MRSRLVITALLAAGVLMATSGVAFALTDATNASVEQYGGGGKGGGGGSSSGGGGGGGGGGGPTLNPTATPPPAVVTPPPVQPPAPPFEPGPPEVADEPPPEVVQEARQLKEGELPFTGFAAVPLMLFGIAFLAGGLALRHTVRARQATPQI